VLGTTISPYIFFWQVSEETEEERESHLLGKDGRPRINWRFIHNMRIDTIAGMFFYQVVAWSIIVVTATVLHGNGVTTINMAADAAQALQPLVHTFSNAGYIAKVLFAMRIIGLGLLSVPVLAGLASYAVSGSLQWSEGLDQKLTRARGFYGVIIVAILWNAIEAAGFQTHLDHLYRHGCGRSRHVCHVRALTMLCIFTPLGRGIQYSNREQGGALWQSLFARMYTSLIQPLETITHVNREEQAYV